MKTPINDHNDLFRVFGEQKEGITLSPSNSFEQNVAAMTEHYNDTTEPGHGMFFDFSETPEYEKPVLDTLIKDFGWILENPFFIRKQELN